MRSPADFRPPTGGNRLSTGLMRAVSRGGQVLIPTGIAQRQVTQQGVQSAQRSFSRLGSRLI